METHTITGVRFREVKPKGPPQKAAKDALVNLAAEFAKLDRLCERGRKEPFFEKFVLQGDAGRRMILAMLERMGPNRALSAEHAAKITKDVNRGRWRLTHQGIAFDTNGKCRDGLHRLTGWLQSDPDKVITTWIYFGLDPDAFHNIDVNHLTRRAKHLLSIAGFDNSARAAAALRVLTVAWKMPDDDESLLMQGNELKGNRAIFDEAVRAGTRARRIARSSAVSAAYYHIAIRTKRREALSKFWEKLVSGENINADDRNVAAIFNLRNLLLSKEYSRPTLRGAGGQWEIVWKHAGAVVNGWNAWLKGHKGSRRSLEWERLGEFPDVEG